MKLKLGTLKKVIREAAAPEVTEADGLQAPGSEQQPVSSMAASLVSAIKRGRVSAEDLGNGVVYIMTGEAEGITVKVLRRGR